MIPSIECILVLYMYDFSTTNEKRRERNKKGNWATCGAGHTWPCITVLVAYPNCFYDFLFSSPLTHRSLLLQFPLDIHPSPSLLPPPLHLSTLIPLCPFKPSTAIPSFPFPLVSSLTTPEVPSVIYALSIHDSS